MKLKINKSLQSYEVGTIIEVDDNKGVPLDRYWRDRLKDAAIDGCVEIVKETTNAKKS